MLGFLGGTGPEGRGLAMRFAKSGEQVFIGSRTSERGIAAARSLQQKVPSNIHGGTNEEAAENSEVIFLATPYEGLKATIKPIEGHLRGKIVITVVAPLSFDNGKISSVPPKEGSAAVQIQNTIPQSKIVGAFHNVSASDLLVPNKPIDCDVIVCSDDDDAKGYVIKLSEKIEGIRGVNGGELENSKYVEEMTALLLNINKIYKAHTSIKITGL